VTTVYTWLTYAEWSGREPSRRTTVAADHGCAGFQQIKTTSSRDCTATHEKTLPEVQGVQRDAGLSYCRLRE